MNADIAVINAIAASGPVGLYIGGSAMGIARVFPGDVPQGEEFPHIVVDLFDGEPFDTKDGPSVVDNELVKVFSYATDIRTVKDMAKKVRIAIDGLSGTYGGETVKDIRYLRMDSYNIPLTNKKVYVREQDYQVRIKVS